MKLNLLREKNTHDVVWHVLDVIAAENPLSHSIQNRIFNIKDISNEYLGIFEAERIYRVVSGSLNEAAPIQGVEFKRLQLKVKSDTELNAHASLRVSQITDFAKKVLGDEERATRWLTKPNPSLNNQVPLSLAETKLGARQVETVLKRIAYGDYS